MTFTTIIVVVPLYPPHYLLSIGEMLHLTACQWDIC